jgi:hypothetical protein
MAPLGESGRGSIVPQQVWASSGGQLVGDEVAEPPPADCPKCLRRWSSIAGAPFVRGDEAPDDEVTISEEWLTGGGGELRNAGREGSTHDAGMSTVDYAVGTVVAAAFAAVLYKIVTGDSVIAGLTNLINTALSTSF